MDFVKKWLQTTFNHKNVLCRSPVGCWDVLVRTRKWQWTTITSPPQEQVFDLRALDEFVRIQKKIPSEFGGVLHCFTCTRDKVNTSTKSISNVVLINVPITISHFKHGDSQASSEVFISIICKWISGRLSGMDSYMYVFRCDAHECVSPFHLT